MKNERIAIQLIANIWNISIRYGQIIKSVQKIIKSTKIMKSVNCWSNIVLQFVGVFFWFMKIRIFSAQEFPLIR